MLICGCIIIIQYQCTLFTQLLLNHHHHFQVNSHSTKNHVLCACCIRRPREVREHCKAMRWYTETSHRDLALGQAARLVFHHTVGLLRFTSSVAQPVPSAWSSNKIHDSVKSPQINSTITVTGL